MVDHGAKPDLSASPAGSHRGGGVAPRARRPATLASLAAELGVSRTTVSNAYNRPDQLSPQLRERVLTAAKQLGYPGPDPLARSLRTRHAGTVGLLFTEALSYAFRDPAAVSFLSGLAQSCEDAKTGLLLVPALPGSDSDTALATQAPVDGFVAYSLPRQDPQLIAALARPVPAVVVDEPVELADIAWVGIDDYAAAANIGRHLASLGHQQVGVVCTRISAAPYDRSVGGLVSYQRQQDADYDVLRLRINGIADGLGVAREPLPVVECWEHTPEAGQRGARALLAARPEITAIACTTDILAMGALQAANELGRAVPDQLSITGFDDIPAAAELGLTTIRQSHVEKGRAAWELLQEATTAAQGRSLRRLLPTELVVRTSTAPRSAHANG